MTNVDVIIADHAQVADGRLFVSGGGINVARYAAQAPAGQPYLVSLAIAGVVDFFGERPWGTHTIGFDMVDADGHAAGLAADGARFDLTGELTIEIAAPTDPDAVPEATVPFVFNLEGAPLASLGRHSIRAIVDGEYSEPKTFTLWAPPATVVFGDGLGEFTPRS